MTPHMRHWTNADERLPIGGSLPKAQGMCGVTFAVWFHAEGVWPQH